MEKEGKQELDETGKIKNVREKHQIVFVI